MARRRLTAETSISDGKKMGGIPHSNPRPNMCRREGRIMSLTNIFSFNMVYNHTRDS